MSMGSTGTVNVSAKMFDDIKSAVAEYRSTTAALKTELEGEINGLVGKDFIGSAANGFKAFYTNNIEPANGDGLTKLLDAIDQIADAAKSALPGAQGLDDQLGDANNQTANQ